MALRVQGDLGDLAHRLLHVQVVSRLQRAVHRRGRRRHQCRRRRRRRRRRCC